MVTPVLRGRVRLGAKRPDGGASLPSCRIYLAGLQSVGAGAFLELDTLYGADPHGFADLANNRLVVPTGLGGRYLLTATCRASYTAAGDDMYSVDLTVDVNETSSPLQNRDMVWLPDAADYEAWLTISDLVDLADGDAVKLFVNGFVALTLNQVAEAAENSLALVRIADVPPEPS